MSRHLSWACAALAACASAGAIAACGGDSGANAGTRREAAGTYSKAEVQKRLAEDYKGTFQQLPASGPKAVPGKRVAIIPSTQQAPTLSDFTREATAAADALGWKSSVIDGGLSTQGYNKAIREATSQRPDAILVVGINCPTVKQAVAEAQRAGIRVYSVYGVDCKPKVWDGEQPVDRRGSARMRADWIASKIGPDGKVVDLYLTDDPVTVQLQDATSAALKKVCPGCDIAEVKWSLGDLGDTLKEKAQTGLLRNPDANAFMVPIDSSISFGVGAALQASGRHLAIMGGECATPNLQLIRAGTQENACTGLPFSVWGWASMDALNRMFAGKKPVDAGLGTQLVDQTHNLPPKGEPFLGPLTDFREHYKQLWGV